MISECISKPNNHTGRLFALALWHMIRLLILSTRTWSSAYWHRNRWALHEGPWNTKTTSASQVHQLYRAKEENGFKKVHISMLPTKLLDLKHQCCGCAPVRVVWKQKECKTIMTAVLPIFATDSHSFRCWNFGSATRSVFLVATNFGPNHDLCNLILKQMKVSPILLDELAKDTSCRAMLKNLRIRCSETQQSERVCQCIVLKQTVRNHCLNNKEL